MIRIKKLSALLLAILMLMGLAACDTRDVTQAVQSAAELVEVLNEIQSAAEPAAEPQPEEAEPAPALEAAEPEDAPAEEPEAEEPEAEAPAEDEQPAEDAAVLDPDGWYTSKEDVALYLHTYGELPGNFITKNEARALGWSGGGLDDYADGKSIGGDRFGNYEGLLPDADGREYHECDIDTMHASSRGAKRIVYSNDGLIYYTEDHYESYTLLYPEE